MTTKRQRAAVRFCEQWLYIQFEGDIHNFNEVSYFLSIYLEDAKREYEEAYFEYTTWLWEKY